MPQPDRLPVLLVVLGWGVAAVASGVALWNGDAALQRARRHLLLAETAAAAHAFADTGGADRVARTLAGRWARSAVVRPDVTTVQVGEDEGSLVGRGPVRDAAGRPSGTVAVLERRDLPRGLPPWLVAASVASLAVLLALSMASVRRSRHVLAWLTAAVTALAPAILVWHWTTPHVLAMELAGGTALRAAGLAAPTASAGAPEPDDTAGRGASLGARTLGPGLLGASAWLVLAAVASPRRARRIH